MNTLSMEPFEYVDLFKKTNTELYNSMRQITNDIYEDGKFVYTSPAHSEGSIWSHTMMVLNNIIHSSKSLNTELILAALLHDIGKVYTIGERVLDDGTRRRTFYNHHSYGSIICVDVLKKMFGDKYYEVVDAKKIIELINLHMFFHFNFGTTIDDNYYVSEKESNRINKVFSDRRDFFVDLIDLIRSDSLGRITKSSEYRITMSKDRLLKNALEHLDSEKREEKDNEVIMLIGLPGSGKTTYRNSIKGYTVISQDDWVEEEAKERGIMYKEMFTSKYSTRMKVISNNILQSKFSNAISKKENIIIDMTNLSLKSRRHKLNVIPEKYYSKKAIVFNRSLEDLKKVNTERIKYGRDIPDSTFKFMVESFCVPTDEEFDKIEYIFN